MLSALYSLSSLAISQLLFLALLYLLFFRRNIGAALPLLLCICSIGMVIRLTTLVTGYDSFLVMYLSQRLTQAVPAVIWVLSYRLFADNQRVPITAWIVIASYQIVLAILPFFWEPRDPVYLTASRASYLVMLSIGLHVISMSLSGRADDLILKRRRLRVPFAAGIGLICATLFGVVFFVSIFYNDMAITFGRITYLVCIGYIFIFALSVNLAMISLFSDTPQFSQLVKWDSETTDTPSPQIQQEINPRTVERVARLMDNEKLFTNSELTITALAQISSIKEHKLRRVINKGMGFRNFNQFLNHYRIREACRLLSSETSDLSISLIALEVGYSSLSSFNKAFKDLTGVTPSVFRENPDIAISLSF